MSAKEGAGLSSYGNKKIEQPIVALITDFGLTEECVAVCKGVILKKNRQTKFVDVTHEIDAYNIKKAAFILYSLVGWLDADIFISIVDPGVGSERLNLVAETESGFFIGPDNGLLSAAIKRAGVKRIISAENHDYLIKPVSGTFYGRDVFSSLAAHIVNGTDISEFGQPVSINELVPEPWSQPVLKKDKLFVEAIDNDHFGSIRTNYTPELDANKLLVIKPGKRVFLTFNTLTTIVPVVRTYSDLEEGNLGVLFDSTGHLTIFSNKQSASRLLNIRPGDKIELKIV